MPESLLAASAVKLFGRLVDEGFLKVDKTKVAGSLGQALGRLAVTDTSKFARIYGFSFEGQYYDLARPAIFLVQGDGTPVTPVSPVTGDGKSATPVPPAIGVAVEPPKFASDVLVWDYDRDDFLLRIDVETGPLERILLEAELGPDQLRAGYAGQTARLNSAGQTVRLRYAGQTVRLQGGRGGGLND